MKKSIFIIALLCIALMGWGQSITINNTFDPGPFGQGSSIAVPITISGCFNVGNSFNLYLSDNNGSFVNNTLIGTFTGFFTTYVNGTIPFNMSSGAGYKLKVVSTNPSPISSNISNAFAINAVSGPIAKVNPSSGDFILGDQKYFGWCSNIKDNNLVSLLNQSTSGATVTAILKNEITGSITNPSISSNQFNLTVSPYYYTLTIKAVSSGIVGTFSYFIINSPNKMALSTNGEQRGCLPDLLAYQFITTGPNGLQDNFPGTQYRVDWGDGASDFYKHCEVLSQNGNISHAYKSTSCGEKDGVFSVTTTLQNLFYVSGGSQPNINCEQPQINTKARILLKSNAAFSFPAYACQNKNVTFINNSASGQGQNGTGCISSAKYGWYVDDVLVNPSTSDVYQSSPINLTYLFPTPGKHVIKLTVYNGSCDTAKKVDTICIEPTPIPDFSFNAPTCASSSFTPVNLTNSNPCKPMTYNWYLLDSLNQIVPSSYYNISDYTAFQPTITINQPGKYKLGLGVTNSCGTIYAVNKDVIVSGKPIVTLPPITASCDISKPIDFSTAANRPTYDIQYGANPTYSWAITPVGSFSYGGGTSAVSPYPQVTFNTYNTNYTVSVTYSNNCGSSTSTQQITFSQPPTFTATPKSYTICSNTNDSIYLVSNPVGIKYTWTTSASALSVTGYSSQATPLATTGIIQKLVNTGSGSGTVTYVITPIGTSGCSGQSQSVTITVNPGTSIANAGVGQKLCNAVSTTLSGNTAATGTGVWTKIFGSSGTIDTPSSPTSTLSGLTSPDSIALVWTIQNTLNSCPSSSDTVIILNRLAVTVANAGNDTTVCGFPSPTSNTSIPLNANINGARYYEIGTWTIVSGPAAGHGSIPQPNNPKTTFSFFSVGTYVLKWTIINDAGCSSMATFTLKVYGKTVKGTIGATNPATTNVCAGVNATVTLSGFTGNILKWQYKPKPVTNNIWIDTLVTTSSITFNNVQDTFSIRAIVVSADAPCPASDTALPIIINVAPQSIGGTTGPNATVCGSSNGGTITLTGQVGSIIRWEQSVDNGANWTTINNTTTTLNYTNISQTTKYRAIVQSGSCSSATSTITTISVAGASGNSNAGSNQFLCNQTSTQLNASVPPNGSTGVWTQISTPLANITNPSLYNTTVTGLTVNTYKFVWSISNGVCPATNDTVVITNYSVLTNTITGINTTICAGQSVTITGQTPTGGNGVYTYQWQQSTDSITWVNIAGQTAANITYNPTTTGYTRRFVTSNTCSLPSNAATITVQPGIANNIISTDYAICIGGSVNTLTGTTPTGGNGIYTYQWESSTDGGTTWVALTNATNSNYLPTSPTITTQYRRRVSSNICAGPQALNSNIVTITVNANAKAQYTYTKDVDCAVFNLTTVIQNITNNANGSYIWYANNVQIGTGAAMSAYSITNPFDSVTIKLKAISLYGCKNDSIEHKFYTVPKPAPAFTVSDTVGCGPLSVIFTNKTPNANFFNFKWDFGNGVTSTVTNPGTVILQPNTTHFDTIYNVTLTATTPCDTVKTMQKIRVKSKPQALFTPNKTVGCSPFPVTFSNTSRGNITGFVWDYGDGSPTFATANANAVQHIYSTGKQDTFKVKLIAFNECGNDTLTYSIVVSANKIKLDFAVNGNEASSCLPSIVHFINNTSGATSFSWDFGDGNFLTTTKNIDTVVHTYTTAGTYNVKLEATNGCSDTTDYEAVRVFAKPITKFTASPVTACLGDSIHFTNQTDTATGYTWRYGDGSGSSLTNPLYAYKTAGSYTATLIAVRQYPGIVCVDSAATNISIVAKLTGAFKVSDSVSSCVPFNVVFTNLSTPSALTTWDYNDGSKKDTGDLVQHNFIISGIFNVKMTVVNKGGCTYESFKTITVKGPTGTWVYDKGLICANKPVQFQVNAVNTDSLRFNFGDGTFLTTTNTIVYHTYSQFGNYLPSVKLLAGASCNVTLQGTDTIKIDNVKAGFTATTQKNCGTTTVAFNDTSRAFFGIQKWQWNFGDGAALSNTQSPQHIYTVTNTYPVQLIVYGNSGCNDTAMQQLLVTVNSKPKATIQAAFSGCTNQAVSYAANITSIDSIILKLWKFYDGSSAVGGTITKVYPSAGTFTTTLVIGTINGCYDTSFNTITINPSPIVVASNDVAICKGQSTQLNATGSINYTWSPINNLSCSNCASPIASPTITTPYVVSSTNNFGCTSTDKVLVTVVQPFTITVSANDSICVGKSTRLSASGAFKYNWSPSIGLSSTTVQTPTASPIVTTTYQVTGTDQYNCFTNSGTVVVGVGDYPVLNLGQNQVLAAGTLFTFTPTYTNGPISDWRWTPVTDLSCTSCSNPVATAKNDICYTAIATNIYGCAGSDTLCIKVFCQSTQVFIPNAFIPGTGSGVNDVLTVRSKGVKLVKSFRIFNRWGQVVFERANFPPNDRQYGWDGLIAGKAANSDVYVYTCEVVCENDVPFVYKGNVAILK